MYPPENPEEGWLWGARGEVESRAPDNIAQWLRGSNESGEQLRGPREINREALLCASNAKLQVPTPRRTLYGAQNNRWA